MRTMTIFTFLTLVLAAFAVAGMFELHCDGTGTTDPIAHVWPDSLHFGRVPTGGVVELDFFIENDGGQYADSLRGTVAHGPACSPHYVITNLDEIGSFALAPGEQVRGTMRFNPALPGEHVCDILVEWDD